MVRFRHKIKCDVLTEENCLLDTNYQLSLRKNKVHVNNRVEFLIRILAPISLII